MPGSDAFRRNSLNPPPAGRPARLVLREGGLTTDKPVHSRLCIVACIVAAACLSGCGRRGPLEPPPGAPPDMPVKQAPAKVAPSNAPGGLFRNTSSKADEPAARTDSTAAPKKSSPFILDPLL